MQEENRNYRSLFWPIMLIGVGVFWLLSNLGILPEINIRFLLRLWPVALIAIGLNILFSHRYPWVGALTGFGAVALVIALVFLAPSLGIEVSGDLKTLNFDEPVGSANQATITLDLERYPTTVGAVVDSNALIEAELDTFDDVRFEARGETSKTITLRPVSNGGFNFNFFDLVGEDARWEIGLSPDVPIDLTIDGGSGSTDLNLGGLDLSALSVDGGSGGTSVDIPASSSAYDVDINGGSGSFDVNIARGAVIDASIDTGSGSFDINIGNDVSGELTIDGGSGSVTINTPDSVGIRLVISHSGSGSVRVPGSYDLVDDLGENSRDIGIWESENFDSASHRVEITFDPGSGSFTLR